MAWKANLHQGSNTEFCVPSGELHNMVHLPSPATMEHVNCMKIVMPKPGILGKTSFQLGPLFGDLGFHDIQPVASHAP